MKLNEPVSEGTTFKGVVKRVFKHENAVLVGILAVIIIVIGVMTKGLSVTPTNIRNVLIQSSVRGVSAMGQLLIILTAGIDLSVSGIAIFASVLGASLMTQNPDWSLVASPLPAGAAVAVMLLLGVAIGAFNGAFVSRVGVPALIVTLAMWQMAKGCGYLVGHGASITKLPESLQFIGLGYIGGVPVPVIVFIVVAVIMYFVLVHTSFGRSIYAVGGNPVSAWLAGINVKRIQLSVYVISGFLAALAGLIITSRTMSASMMTAGGLEMDTIAAVVIGGVSLSGGKGTLVGAVIGVLITGCINNGMNITGLDPSFQELVRGAIILVAVTADVIRRRR